MNKKISQATMVWLLPIILAGGLIFAPIGYIVFFMMIFFLTFSYFKGRFWCSHLCPRGAFLDLVLAKLSLKRKLPAVFRNKKFKWLIFFLFMAFFIFQLASAKTLYALGFVFVRMCILTTIIAVLLGIPLLERAWCAICPMGTLQGKIRTLNKNKPTP